METENSDECGTQNCSDNPPQLSFEVPKLSDLPNTCIKSLSDVELPADFLVLTVEDYEFLGFFPFLENPFKSYRKDIGYVWFGSMCGNTGSTQKLKIALMKCSKGSAVPGGSLTVVKNAVRVLRPKAVFSVGACSGLNRGKVKLGDVVVPSKLITVSHKTPASRDIGTLIRHAADGWNKPLENPGALDVRAHCDDEVLSSAVISEDIIQQYPEAIAVEMEGEGVFAAAHDLKTEWAVVKGIKDFADDSHPSSDEWGRFASVMAASVVANILSDPVVFQGWPNYSQEAPLVESLNNVETCQKKLAEHYQKTAKVPTTVWSSGFQVGFEQIYTRLSWVKEEQTPAGSSQKKLSHYTELFTKETKNGAVPKRILVQGETGIGKTTFVKKLLVDWSNLEKPKRMAEERKDVLSKFELVVSINLKDVSKGQTLREVIHLSRLFAKDDESSTDCLYEYISRNQEKVLIVFDGYDEYRIGSGAEARLESPIYEVVQGDLLRACTVLVTTRPSRADELKRSADIQAKITGFDFADRLVFIRKILGNETEVEELLEFLEVWKVKDLARVPLLTLFFCLLWKEEKGKLRELEKSKANLYQAILRHILQHSHGKYPPRISKLNEVDYKEILTEIGKVALVGLLKGDLVFEFGQLPEKVRCKESVIGGLLQVSEYGPSLEATEIVSFVHKSIQEYLAAWYVTYKCVPEGTLGGIEEHAHTLEDCQAFENVFQFICGLSDDGAVKVFQYFTSVRISDQTLDLSKTIPHVENKTDVPLCDLHLTDKQTRFIDIVFGCFQEVVSKDKLVRHWLDSTGGIVLVTRPLHKDVQIALAQVRHSAVFFFVKDKPDFQYSVVPMLYEALEFLDCFHIPLRMSQASLAISVGDFLRKFQEVPTEKCSYGCGFNSVVCFQSGQFRFYVTDMQLHCDFHAKLFTETITISSPYRSTNSCSDQSCLKYARSLFCLKRLSGERMKGLGSLATNCKHWKSIELIDSNDDICDLLEMVPNPGCCLLKIGGVRLSCTDKCQLSTAGAANLADLLPRFMINTLCLDLIHCSASAMNKLVSNITHRTLKILVLSDISLSSAEASLLGRSLPHMALEILYLKGTYGRELQTEDMEALFSGFNKTLPLCELFFERFTVRGSFAPLFRSLRFFPNLKVLCLDESNVSEREMSDLLEWFKSTPHLRNCRCRAICWPIKQ